VAHDENTLKFTPPAVGVAPRGELEPGDTAAAAASPARASGLDVVDAIGVGLERVGGAGHVLSQNKRTDDGGHHRNCTLPTMYFLGTMPHSRLSELRLRWSPNTKSYPSGITSGPQLS
jgi:hypothetical protein